MKMYLTIAIACVFLVSCERASETEKGNGELQKHSCSLPASENGKSSWLPGDMLLIHGEMSADQKIITLTAEDISADGKTCYLSVEGVPPYEQKVVKSRYYVAYPAELVKNPSQCKESTTFTGTNHILMAGYDKGEEFLMESITGGFAFTVSGDFDSYRCKGNNDETMGYTSLTSKITPNAILYAEKRGTAVLEITGSVLGNGADMNHICFVDQPTLADGFMLIFYKNDIPVKYLYTEEQYQIKRGQFIDLGDITSKLSDYKSPAADSHVSGIPTTGAVNLSVEETANCYVVTEPGIYTFKATKGASAESLASIGSVEVLWETWGTSEDVIPGSIISDVDFERDQVYFRIEEGHHSGNAIIAARNDMGAIIWSWHLWVPETEIMTDLYNLSRHYTMDRNLGALVAATSDGATPESIGLLYQWGRKDPFVGVGDFSRAESAKTAGEEITLNIGQMSTAKTIKNPTAFAAFEGNWNPSSTNDFWGSKKGMYDPCPPGYKVPYRSEYLPFKNTVDDIQGWAYMLEKNMFSLGNDVTYFPLGGYLSWDGTYQHVGQGERIWSSQTHSTVSNAYNFRISPDGSGTSYGNSGKEKANGYSVRCVAYDATPFENAPETPAQGKRTTYTVDMRELSGLCLHTDKSFLWGVGDQGELVKLDFEGKVEKVLGRSLDMESVTVDPETGDLYLGCEPDVVFKISAPDYNKPVEVFKIAEAKSYGNSGVEGISWYKDGMILVGTQTGAYMWACKLDGTVVWKKSMRTVAIGMMEIADIHYDPLRDQIWIIDSETQCVYLFNGDATEHLATYIVGFAGNCESVHLDYDNNCVWVADDSEPSRLFKIAMTF